VGNVGAAFVPVSDSSVYGSGGRDSESSNTDDDLESPTKLPDVCNGIFGTSLLAGFSGKAGLILFRGFTTSFRQGGLRKVLWLPRTSFSCGKGLLFLNS